MENEFCNYRGKRIFKTRADARRAIESMNKRTHGNGSVYQCEYCNGWHVTRLPYATGKDMITGIHKRGGNSKFGHF